MSEKKLKTDSLKQILSETALANYLNLSVSKHGRSRTLGFWVKGGLPYIEKSGRRFFFQQDVVDYLMKHYNDRE